jgi:hypothetical protein
MTVRNHQAAQFGNRNLVFCQLDTGLAVLSWPQIVRAHQFRQLEFEAANAFRLVPSALISPLYASYGELVNDRPLTLTFIRCLSDLLCESANQLGMFFWAQCGPLVFGQGIAREPLDDGEV